jgi:hypothetical protein
VVTPVVGAAGRLSLVTDPIPATSLSLFDRHFAYSQQLALDPTTGDLAIVVPDAVLLVRF